MREATNLVCLTDQVLTFRCLFSNLALLKVLADLDSPLDVCSEAKFKCGEIATIFNVRTQYPRRSSSHCQGDH
jgi:hypothetical protein